MRGLRFEPRFISGVQIFLGFLFALALAPGVAGVPAVAMT
jgi:hypothetical protein